MLLTARGERAEQKREPGQHRALGCPVLGEDGGDPARRERGAAQKAAAQPGTRTAVRARGRRPTRTTRASSEPGQQLSAQASRTQALWAGLVSGAELCERGGAV